MTSETTAGDRARAHALLRRFARSTNLLIAGTRFAVRGDGPIARALDDTLRAMGARRHTTGGPLDYLFCTGEGVPPLTAPDVAAALAGSPDGRRPLVVVPAADALGAGTPARPGVRIVVVDGREVAVVGEESVVPAGSGEDRIRWARRFMPVSRALADELARDSLARGVRIGLSMVLEPKTAVLALLLADAGAEVVVFAHPDETDDDVADALRERGLRVFARSDATRAEHRALALDFVDEHLDLLLDDGSSVIRLAHLERPDAVGVLRGAAEETTSGLRPLRVMAAAGLLRVPVVAVNDARTKTDFDNRYGTGQSCVLAILDLLERAGADASIDGRAVVVAGFGPVGEGVARHCAALGAHVTVTETDPVRALRAAFEGYAVAPLLEAVGDAHLVISATGIAGTIDLAALEACAPDAAVAVGGGVPQEIAVDDALAAGATRERIGPKLERLHLPSGVAVRLLDDGGCINITAGEGNPIEIMDLSFAVQLAAVRRLLEGGGLADGVHPLDPTADALVAAAALAGRGSAIDTASPAQREFLDDWYPTRFDRPSE